MQRSQILCLILGLMHAGCPEKSPGTDAPLVDLISPAPDSSEAGEEGLDLGYGDLVADALPEAGGDQEVPDALPWDVPLSKATALYIATPTADSFGVRIVATDGTGPVTPVSGWSGYVDLEPLYLAGLQEYIPVSAKRPQVTSDQLADFRGVLLPGQLGTLYYFHRKLYATSGLLLVQPQGSLKVLLEVPGIYADTLSTSIGLSQEGKVGAVVQGGTKVLLFLTDGKTFSGGASYLDISPAGLTLKSVDPFSLTLAGSWLYCVAADSSGDLVLRAPLDGSAALTKVTLPQSSGQVPKEVDSELAVSEDGSTLVLAAGSLPTFQDLYVLGVSSKTAVNATKSPGYMAGRGDTFGYIAGQLALSPKGVLLAYVKQVSGIDELFVTASSGSTTPVQVSTDARFDPGVTTFYSLFFADDDNLLFVAGQGAYSLDIYNWDHKAKTLANLTKTGSFTPPMNGQGAYGPRGGWVSSSGKWLYLVGYSLVTHAADILGVERATRKLVTVTKGLEVAAFADGWAACPGSGKVYFAAELSPQKDRQEVWVFDQDLAQKATRLTSMSAGYPGQWYIGGLTLDASCSRLTWSAGGSYYTRDLWTLSPASGKAPKKLTANPLYVAPSMQLSPDGQTLLFASGGTAITSTLKAVTIFGKAPLTLDSKAGYVHLLAVY